MRSMPWATTCLPELRQSLTNSPDSPVTPTLTDRLPRRRLLLAGVLLGALLAAWWLGLRPAGALPSPHGWQAAGTFSARRCSRHGTTKKPDRTACHLCTLSGADRKGGPRDAAHRPAAAVSLSLAGGLILGFLGSRVWWPERRTFATRMVVAPARLLADAAALRMNSSGPRSSCCRGHHSADCGHCHRAALLGHSGQHSPRPQEETPQETRVRPSACSGPGRCGCSRCAGRMRAEMTCMRFTGSSAACAPRQPDSSARPTPPASSSPMKPALPRSLDRALCAAGAGAALRHRQWVVRRRVVRGTTARHDRPLQGMLLVLAGKSGPGLAERQLDRRLRVAARRQRTSGAF